MNCDIVVGGQFGDEGKAKIIDYLSRDYDYIVRYAGGANAGHTVEVEHYKFVFHLLPSGLLHPGKVGCIGNGVVLDPKQLFIEIDQIKEKGYEIKGNLYISNYCHLVMPYHKLLDKYREEKKGKGSIGTTLRGIGPCYEDKYSRCGFRLIDLYLPDFKDRLKQVMEEKNFLFTQYFGESPLSFEQTLEDYLEFTEKLAPFRKELTPFLHSELKQGKSLLLEGAQGTYLDIDFGTYPFVTSSNATTGGACTGTGVPPNALKKIYSVFKAYMTRVGSGPFPTELDNEEGERLRNIGHEYGATTGRPRRCGWFDLVAGKHTVMINGTTDAVITKLDVLSGFQAIKVCTGYKINDEIIPYFPTSGTILQQVEPVYEELEGWQDDISQAKHFSELPSAAQNYIHWLEKQLETRISIVSVGAKRSQTIMID
jgi:adenylosuccinate synthase